MSSASIENKVLDLESEEVPVWIVRSFQLVSLFEMIIFNAREFFRLSQFMKAIEFIVEKPDNSTLKMGEQSRQVITEDIESMIGICNEAGLELSAMQLHRIKDQLSTPDLEYKSLSEPLRQLHSRIRDELQLNLFMAIPRARAGYYEKTDPFGLAVSTKFPSASYDIQEAGNCLATGRYTACVMHLMRSLEVALDAVGLGVGLPNAVIEATNSWERLLSRINTHIQSNDSSGDPTWPPKRQFFVDTHAHLYTVKNAWRNPSMHLEKKYDDREAERIFRAVEDFMGHIATHLEESGVFTP